jgi:hypothetical protein
MIMETRRNKFLDINEHGKAVAQSFDENGNLVEEEMHWYLGTSVEINRKMARKTDKYIKEHGFPWAEMLKGQVWG